MWTYYKLCSDFGDEESPCGDDEVCVDVDNKFSCTDAAACEVDNGGCPENQVCEGTGADITCRDYTCDDEGACEENEVCTPAESVTVK